MSDSARRERSASSVIAEATIKQRVASDPLISSWVGASAGSGKTKVLTDRMLRLLLPREDGSPPTRPEKILALTFTKAAANEMAIRLSRRLSQWAVMDDASLTVDIESLLGRQPVPAELTAARKLFARVVDTPGGLNIMTIHSFCQSVLGRFPVEAELPPHFKPLEEEQAHELLDRARKDILTRAGTEAASPLSQAIARISTLVSEDQFETLLRILAGERRQMEDILKRTFGIDGLYTNLCGFLGIRAGLDEEMAFQDFCTGGDEPGLREACAHLAVSDKSTDTKKAALIQSFWDALPQDRKDLYPAYRKAFLTDKGEPLKATATTGTLKKAPHIHDILSYETGRLTDFENVRKAVLCASATTDLFRIGEAVLTRYQNLKQQKGVLDFDDLILKTLSLLKGETKSLEGMNVSRWIMYKLDEGLDHILVDEAQDTNPEQWDIIRLLSDDFFDGSARDGDVRSLFVVGDEKQSIFSFQRAAPEKFGEMFRWFERKIIQSGQSFVPVDINTSFRSVQVLLDAVDTVFANPQTVRGLTDKYLNHIAKREGQAGIVEIWPLFRTTGTDKEQDENAEGQPPTSWFMPDKLEESQSGSLKMANQIGDMIKIWLTNKEILQSHDRPVQPGDIMVLVRSRNAFVAQLVRALKSRGVPVSGVDRMVLGDQLIVQDLCAAAAFALLPEDDLALACLLKSPFIGMNEDTLYSMAQGRTGNLWQSLIKNGDRIIVDWFSTLLDRAGSDHPYEFFSKIVQEPCPANTHSGMQAIRVRLGEDALDPLDEFLNMALSYESSHSAGLQGFLKWHEQGSSEIKRQMEEGGGAVRIMTVHGSKGLQAPIVFLPDTVRTAASAKPDTIYWPHKTSFDVPFYVPSGDLMPEAALDAKQRIAAKADEEYRRLLYVAMTRAEERLYIGGYTGKRAPAKDSKTAYWYDDVRTALAAHPETQEIPSGVRDEDGQDVPTLRLSSARTAEADKTAQKTEEKKHTNISLPVWAYRQAPAEPFPPRPLVPSRPSGLEPAAASPMATSQTFRFRRGTATHKLLQILPDLPVDKREEAARQFLSRPALGLPLEIQEETLREILTILDDASYADIFGPSSLSEIPVTGLVNNRLISGQIDRMVIRDRDILIVDYKTNRPPPQHAQDVSPVYIQQLKAYADTLKEIYPSHTIRCALLWTDGARLMEIAV